MDGTFAVILTWYCFAWPDMAVCTNYFRYEASAGGGQPLYLFNDSGVTSLSCLL